MNLIARECARLYFKSVGCMSLYTCGTGKDGGLLARSPTRFERSNEDEQIKSAHDYQQSASESNDKIGSVSLKEWLEELERTVNFDLLSDDERVIHKWHVEAVKNGQEKYADEIKGRQVFTVLGHLRRGYCCGNVCRHCPYFHVNAPLPARSGKRYNTAFYS